MVGTFYVSLLELAFSSWTIRAECRLVLLAHSVKHLLPDQYSIIRLIGRRILVEWEYCAAINLSTDKDERLRITKR